MLQSLNRRAESWKVLMENKVLILENISNGTCISNGDYKMEDSVGTTNFGKNLSSSWSSFRHLLRVMVKTQLKHTWSKWSQEQVQFIGLVNDTFWCQLPFKETATKKLRKSPPHPPGLGVIQPRGVLVSLLKYLVSRYFSNMYII